MEDRITTLALEFGEKILKGKYSTKRIMAMCGCTESEARQIREKARNGFSETQSAPVAMGQKVWFDSAAGKYLASLPGVQGLVVMDKDVHQGILEGYSNASGSAATVAELARTYNLSKELLQKYIRACGITHNSLPLAGVEYESLGEDEAAKLALERIENSVAAKVGRELAKKQAVDAAKWNDIKTSVLDPLSDRIADMVGSYDPGYLFDELNTHGTSAPFAVVTSPTDFHWGKFGDDYNRGIAKRKLFTATKDVIRKVSRFGAPDCVYIGVASDWFHIDNIKSTTTKGTPQDVDGTWEDIFITGCELAVQYIDMMRTLAPVKLIMMAGNHDYQSSISLMMYLSAWYRHCDDVEVFKCASPRQYATYGKNMFGFTHGDGANGEKLARLMAIEGKEAWAETNHRSFFTGNFHHEWSREFEGVVLYQMPALCGTDRWHRHKGYMGARKLLPAYILDKEEGVIASLFASPAEDPEAKQPNVIL